MNRKCVVIGSGLGGLSMGVVLSRSGYEVTVLEQSNQIGGCLQCFERGDAKFETGMHMIGSMDEGQVLSHYLNFLGIKDKIELSRLDTNAYDIVKLHGENFSFANGHEAMVERLGARFPKEKDNLVRYWQLVDQIAEATPYYRLTGMKQITDYDISLFTHSVNEVLDSVIGDPLLKEVLMGNIALYAARRDRTPFSSHAFINDFYNRSAFRIVGGSDSIVKALSDEIEGHGGSIRVHSRVIRALCKNGAVDAVVLDNGEIIRGDLFISSIHPALMTQLFVGKELRPAYIHRLQSIENTVSVFSLFVKFRPHTVPYLNSNHYVFVNGGPWDLEDYDDNTWPRGYIYMHRCHERNPQYADTGVIIAYMSANELARWSDTRVGRRGDAYEAFKREKAAKLLAVVERDFPGIIANIERQYTASPLTYRDYTLTPGGAMYGMVKDVTLGIGGRVSYRTKLPNLFLVGQNIKAHGILGVLVSTLDVSSIILGEEEVRRSMLERNAALGPASPSLPDKNTVLVMGGGLGGLVCGALLAKEGRRVTVLEKNGTAGGGLLCFRRHGVNYPTGIHIFGGFRPGEQLYKICSYLGILDKLRFVDIHTDTYDEVVSLTHNRRYRLPKGREAYMAFLCETFPHATEEIHNYMDALYRLVEEEDLFFLRPQNHTPFNHSKEFFWAADQFIAHYISDPELRELFGYLIPLYAGVANETPAYIHALINISHIEGTMQFADGSQQFADALMGVIEAGGGKVLCGEKITSFAINDERCIREVSTSNGHTYTADTFVSDIPVTELIGIAPQGAFPRSFRNRMAEAPNSYSSFKVYLRLKDGEVPFTHSTTFCSKGERNVWNQFDGGEAVWPQLMMFIAHPDSTGRFVQAITIISPMLFDYVRQWEHTTVGHRGDDYLEWKRLKTEQLIDFLDRVEPGIRRHIDAVEASSPLTIRDYYGNREGFMFGLHRDVNHIMRSQLSINTKLKNLFLTGQWVNIHGLCGVSLSAVSTVETVLNDSMLRTRIRHSSEV
ncbi:MAG: NAD(P)/FAD-dependent oxidoreductase [Bacteroidales bacterium]|nr:NAD(P)/FAD-dependent oxidoreductase [Bacteroidales bacterium]